MTATTAVRERPILFSGLMVRAILEGQKTQTRRVVKGEALSLLNEAGFCPDYVANPANALCPYGVRGDRLWVRETWQSFRTLTPQEQANQDAILDRFTAGQIPTGEIVRAALSLPKGTGDPAVLYAADFGDWAYDVDSDLRPWKPSIHMPRWASRITLEITDVRVQRVQEISDDDAIAEGVGAVAEYARLWDQINGKKHPWSSNPWVWAISFRRIA